MWYRRARPLFRILLCSLAVLLAFSASEALVSLLGFGRTARAVASALITSAVTIAVYCIYQRYIEKRLVSEFSLQGAIKELAMGAALGALLLASTIAILALLGVYRVVGTNTLAALIGPSPARSPWLCSRPPSSRSSPARRRPLCLQRTP